MKYTKTWMLISMFVMLSCGKHSSEGIYLRAQASFRQGNLPEASEILRGLIYQPASQVKEQTYMLFDSVLSSQERRRSSYLESQHPRSERAKEKGTITLTLGYMRDSVLQTFAEERIRLAQMYLATHPHGSEREYFLSVLISSFGYVPENQQDTVSLLVLREANEKRREQFLILSGWVFHSRSEYQRATERYNEIIQGSNDPGTKTLFRLYVVDCLYQVGRCREAAQVLDEALASSPEIYRPMAEGMAKRWKLYLKDAEKFPAAKKKTLVYFQ